MVLQGQTSLLYPPLDATTYVGLPFDLLAHRLLPGFPASLPAMFMYAPPVALFCVPFALAAPGIAMLAWQLACLVSLLTCAVWLARLSSLPADGAANAAEPKSLWLSVFLASFSFAPVAATIWIGQSGLLFATLPLTAGACLLLTGRSFWAGLCLSFIYLKPQVLPVAFLIAFALSCCRNFVCGIGLVVGLLALVGFSIVSSGLDVFARWLHSLSVSETLLSSAAVRSPLYLIAGLPGGLVSQLPAELRLNAKWLVYGIGAVLALLVAAVLVRLAKSAASPRLKTLLIVIVAVASLPIYSPRLLLYDLCVFLPAAVLIYVVAPLELAPLKRWADWVWMLVNVYVALVIAGGEAINPLLLDLGILALQIPLWRIVCRMAPLKPPALST